ncbi:unnamed protein product, partial [Allacma fusca]
KDRQSGASESRNSAANNEGRRTTGEYKKPNYEKSKQYTKVDDSKNSQKDNKGEKKFKKPEKTYKVNIATGEEESASDIETEEVQSPARSEASDDSINQPSGNERKPDITHPYLKEQISVSDLHKIISVTNFTRKKAILSLGQYEINYGGLDSRILKRIAAEIIELLKEKGFTRIILLFPVIKPKTPGRKPVQMDTYYAYRRALQTLEDDIVSFWWTPAAVFLDLKRDYRNHEMRQFRVDKDFNMIPIQHKFHQNKKNGRYFPSFSRKTEFLNELDKMYNHDYYKIPRQQKTSEYSVEEEVTEQIVIEDGVQVEVTNTKSLIEKTKKDLTGSVNKEVDEILKKVANLKKFMKPKALQKLLDKIGIPVPPGAEKNQKQAEESSIEVESTEVHVNQLTGAEQQPESSLGAQPTNENLLNAVRANQSTPKPALREDQIQESVSNQLLGGKKKTFSCVIPLKIDDITYPAQLDTGATPNIISEETANILLRDHYDSVEYIRLKKPLICHLADDAKVETLYYAIVPKINFGNHELMIPFYVLQGCNQVFIIGTNTMETLKMYPDVENKRATCQPTKDSQVEVLEFMNQEEYRKKLTIRQMRIVEGSEEEIAHISNKASLADEYDGMEPEDFDDGPKIFLETLAEDLKQAVAEGIITKKQSLKAFEVLQEFACVFSKYPGKYTGPKMKLTFKDPKNIKKFHGPKYTPSNKQMPLVREAVRVMLAKKIVEPSKSPYINAIVVNIKKNGEVRLCLNPMELNQILENDYNETGLLDRIVTTDGRAKMHCCLDFVASFWQMVLHEAFRKYCAFIVDGEVLQFIRVPYGLKVSTALFVALINKLIKTKKGITKYVDDILLKAMTFEEMMVLLVEVLEILRDNGLKLNPRKSRFFKKSTPHLGFTIEPGVLKKQSKKIEKLDEFKKAHTSKKGSFQLKNEKEVMAFLGIIGYYKRFIADYQQIAKPLYDVIRKENFKWGEDQQAALEELEKQYRKDFKLMTPVEGQDFYLETKVT